MAKNIGSLLAKKGWTGEEVGKALVASLLHDIKNQGKSYEPLFTQADFDKMEGSLSKERDFLAYGVYRDIYSSIVETYNKGQALYQQFYNGYYRYSMYLNGAMRADHALADIENYPLIMTEGQYKKAEQDTLEYKKTFGESYYSLFFNLLEGFLYDLENGKAKSVPAEIKKAIEATKKVPAEKYTILSSYNELCGNGYETLPDGRRSDNMTAEEWQEALKDTFIKDSPLYDFALDQDKKDLSVKALREGELLKGYELFFNGIDDDFIESYRRSYKEHTGEEPPAKERIEEILKSFLDDTGNGKYSPDEKDLMGFLGMNVNTEWHTYTEAPEGLTGYDLLDITIDSSRYEETDEKEHLSTFKKEYPALYTALDAYIRETVPEAKGLKPSQLYNEFVSWGELAEKDIADYKEQLTVADSDIIQYLQRQGLKFADSRRAGLRGIAVIKQPRSYQLDADGNYKEEHDPLKNLESIDAIAEDMNTRETIEALQEKLFKPALRYLYAYNELVKIIGAVYDINEAEVAQISTETFESQLKALNNLLYSFYYLVYGDEEEKARKRGLIKEIFNPVDIEGLKPTAEAIQTVKEELSQLGVSNTARKTLSNFEGLIAMLGKGA